jgi:spermidine synthase
MPALLLVAFGLSGCAALLFQTLWFRQAGLVFGNSVWATSLVLASFMGGLALGNGLARGAARVRRPFAVYAALELAIAGIGVGLVVGLPHLTRLLAPWLSANLASPPRLNLLRLAGAFALLLVPTTAMGATLPVLMRAVSASIRDFGPALGRLYGWNTLGAVAGATLGELLLIERLGVRGTGLVAGTLGLLAALCALVLARSREGVAPAAPTMESSPPPETRLPSRITARLLAGGALCGGALLALEVVWFRFLQLFVAGTSLAFAVMLTVVLLGIALGGLLGARWLHHDPQAHLRAPELAAGAGVSVFLTYGVFAHAIPAAGSDLVGSFSGMLALSTLLMLPTSTLSGLLFTFLGRALREGAVDGARVTGGLTLANTTGGMAGALSAGFLLLPGLGIERGLLTLGLLYGLVGLLLHAIPPPPRPWRGAAALAFVAAAALFPLGLMDRVYLERVAARFTADGSRPVMVREGLTETILYLRRDLLGEPLSYRLVTNGFSMSSTSPSASRYMTLYVHWPMAVRPQSRRALLISYGVGVTARALVRQRGLEHIDVVDISRDILELGRVPLPPGETYPLEDPRVRPHVEDGRFFLLTTRERYDLITAEPPPPGHAGSVNLYSEEYFTLVRERLLPGGLVTYWLPVFEMDVPTSQALVRAFCNVFPDCSLWTGATLNWMLVGSQGGAPAPPEEAFAAQWRDPELQAELQEAGLESPERLGARFLGDADFLRTYAGDVPPLVDDWPLRLRRTGPGPEGLRFYAETMDAGAARERFSKSPLIANLWPLGQRSPTLPFFEELRLFNAFHRPGDASDPARARERVSLLAEALVRTGSVSLPLRMAGGGPRESAIARRAEARGEDSPAVHFLLGADALAHRRYREADERFQKVQAREPGFSELHDFRLLAYCLGNGEREGWPRPPAPPGASPDASASDFLARLKQGCGL